jgi:hypothetical protein
MNRVAKIFAPSVVLRIEAARFGKRKLYRICWHLYLWETTAVRQTIDTARIYVSFRRTFVDLLVPAASTFGHEPSDRGYRGLVIVRGIPVEAHPVEDIATIFWAIGTHLGRGVSQSALGDMLGEVRDETPPGQPESARGYLSRRELSLHVDLAQIVGLMCVRQAR